MAIERVQMPSLDGATAWLNSESLGPAQLRGHVVLSTSGRSPASTGCGPRRTSGPGRRRTGPTGLVVIGVDTPEFLFEHEIDGSGGRRQRAIDYPVAVDNNYAIWEAFDNHYWPALYFVGGDGVIRTTISARGLRAVRAGPPAAARRRARLGLVHGTGVEAKADWNQLRSPETYVGYERSEQFASAGGPAFEERRNYQLPESATQPMGAQRVLDGRSREDHPRRCGREHRVPLSARDVHLVLSSEGRDPIPFRVTSMARRRGGGHTESTSMSTAPG